MQYTYMLYMSRLMERDESRMLCSNGEDGEREKELTNGTWGVAQNQVPAKLIVAIE